MTKAVVFESFGLENLKMVDYQAPSPGPGQVRFAVHTISLNYRDLLMVKGLYNPKLDLPLIPCSDAAGTVLEVGPDVSRLAIGDRVVTTMIPDWEEGRPTGEVHKTTLGGPAQGVLALERTLPQQALLKLPARIGFDDACCLPVAGLTAWNALKMADIGRDSRVLLLGTGGVSIMALTIAHTLGAEVVITSSSHQKLMRARALGANHLINYKDQPKWSAVVRELFPGGVDAVLEVGGDGTFDQSVRATSPGGCVALIGVLAAQNKAVNLTTVLINQIRIQGVLVGSRKSFEEYLGFMSAHPLPSVIDRHFDGLEQAFDAFKLMEQGGHFGKIILRTRHR